MSDSEICSKAKDALINATNALHKSMESLKITVPHITPAEFVSLTILQIALFATGNINTINDFSKIPKEVLFMEVVNQIAGILEISCKIRTEANKGVH